MPMKVDCHPAVWAGARFSCPHPPYLQRLAPLLCVQPQSTISSLQTAMALYNCDHYEW